MNSRLHPPTSKALQPASGFQYFWICWVMNLWKLVSGNSSGNFYILKFIQSLAMRNSLLSKINHLSIYQVPKDTKLETRLDVSKVIRAKREMMSLDRGGVFMANVTNMCPWICCKSGQTTTLHLVTVRFSNYTGIYVYPLVLYWLWGACSKSNQ